MASILDPTAIHCVGTDHNEGNISCLSGQVRVGGWAPAKRLLLHFAAALTSTVDDGILSSDPMVTALIQVLTDQSVPPTITHVHIIMSCASANMIIAQPSCTYPHTLVASWQPL